MWGNRYGWTISAVLALLAGALVYFVSAGAKPVGPTDWSKDQAHFAALALPAPPPGALPFPQQDRDAGEVYRQAIDAFEQKRDLYENFAQAGTLAWPQAKELTAIDLLMEASACSRATLFATNPEQVINYDREKPRLEAIRTLGRVCIDRLGLLNQRAGKGENARKFYQAGFALGAQLCRERLSYAELELGLELFSKSTAGLIRVAEDSGRATDAVALRDYDAKRVACVRERIDPILRVVRSIDPNVVGTQTGDVFELANRSQERMWRVEAILALGRVRYFVGAGGTAGTQRSATRMVTKLATEDPDPVIRAAAAAARDLNVEQHRIQ